MTSASHRVLENGVEVHLGGHFHVLTENQAKRLAWGILADLDPDEAKKAGAPKVVAPKRPQAPSTAQSILAALHFGPKTAAQLIEAVGCGKGAISARASELRDRGLVCRTDKAGSRGAKATWAITPAGRAAIVSGGPA